MSHKPGASTFRFDVKLFNAISIRAIILFNIFVLWISVWAGMLWWENICIGVLLSGLITNEIVAARRFNSNNWAAFAAIFNILVGFGFCLLRKYIANDFYTIGAGLAAMPIGSITFCLSSGSSQKWWRVAGFSAALPAVLVGIALAHQHDYRPGFYAGLVFALGLCILSKRWFHMPSPAILAANTATLLIIGVPLANMLVSPADSLNRPPPLADRPFSYDFFRKDPGAFARWHNYHGKRSNECFSRIFNFEVTPFVLRPNSQAMLHESLISINGMGFRGKEISEEKGDVFRIVALGESTTFGVTLYANQQPWPELLDRMINEQLKPQTPVEVINAGIPAYIITENLARLSQQILTLKPDMIISYHGHNGFPLINTSLPPIRTSRPPPRYNRRPLKILADAEYGLKMAHYKKRVTQKSPLSQSVTVDPMNSPFADAYRQLISTCRSNSIQLVLATYSMAVNKQSERSVLDFYHMQVPSLPWQLEANAVHTTIVEKLAALNPDVVLVDTHPGLDGKHAKFIDAIHFAPEGEQQMAETIFSGIESTLRQRLSSADSQMPQLNQNNPSTRQ